LGAEAAWELAFTLADCLLDGVAEAAVVKELELGTASGDEIHPPEMSATTSSVLDPSPLMGSAGEGDLTQAR
jgi:hypothetical protein